MINFLKNWKYNRVKLLSVNEDENRIDRITAAIGGNFRFSITDDSQIQVSGIKENDRVSVDIDELIQFLQEAKQFVSDAQLFKKLKNPK